ncbi:MAG TPA: carboxymuconolactone decarboxylase family protein [Micromonosporaceae bacterium]
MGLEAIKAALPEYAKDIKLNLGSTIANSTLPPETAWGTALACAVAARNPVVLREIAAEAATHMKDEAITAAKGAGAIMGMNNVYYRAKHLIGDEAYASIPARLRMHLIGKPGVDQAVFELWCLAVSAINGCGVCLESHEKVVRKADYSREQVHEALRIAAVVHAAAVTLDAEAALA